MWRIYKEVIYCKKGIENPITTPFEKTYIPNAVSFNHTHSNGLPVVVCDTSSSFSRIIIIIII